jgi:putative spermidine/putrescine transport system ATP-binding protein
VASFYRRKQRPARHRSSRSTASFCRVRLDCGAEVLARAGNVAGAGVRTMLSVRPERAFLVNGPAPSVNVFAGAVKEVIYLGDHVRIRLGLAGSHDFTVKTPISQLDKSLQAGDQIQVAMDPAHISALDAPDAATAM